MTKLATLQYLKQHIQKRLQSSDDITREERKIFSSIESASAEDIIFGEYPSFFCAYMECNSTGVGTSHFGNTTTQNTVALDYTTDQYLFIDGHEGAAIKGLEYFVLKPGETANYYKKSSIKDLAEAYGFELHLQRFRDLNISLTSHRLNRCNVKITRDPTSLPIRPIFLATPKSNKPILVGYGYIENSEDYIIVDFNDVNTSKNSRSCFSPWMLLGFLFPPLLVIALIVIIYRLLTR